MKKNSIKKYKEYRPVELPERTWPNNRITVAPRWCSVDLRDGNQALVYPMSIAEKAHFFALLTDIGFKEIEVGFPSAADVEYNFLRHLVDNKKIPDDVTIQILTQAREHLIRRSFQALEGIPKAVVHLYNSTSTLQRDVVFNMSKAQIKQLAIEGVKLIKELSRETKTKILLEYSPESFSGTEPDYAIEVCSAVMENWGASSENKVILNLPATVEMTTPNLYADQIEYFIKNLPNRENAVVSLHTHNDRGTGVAATEMGLLAGADRVEGTLFGNGERTGNVDIITLALNMATQGIDPRLDFSNINRVVETSEQCTRMPVHPRHPYAGELVFTAFSGSHQDAINKGMAKYKSKPNGIWAVPYLPVDPSDLGRTYDSIIRINSQSGKGGVAYVMEKEFSCRLPKTMHPEFAIVIQALAEKQGGEVHPDDIYNAFLREYIDMEKHIELVSFKTISEDEQTGETTIHITVKNRENLYELQGSGNGPVSATRNALVSAGLPHFSVKNYSEHSLGEGSEAKAISYIQIGYEDSKLVYGVGISPSISRSSIEAIFSAVNRAFGRQKLETVFSEFSMTTTSV